MCNKIVQLKCLVTLNRTMRVKAEGTTGGKEKGMPLVKEVKAMILAEEVAAALEKELIIDVPPRKMANQNNDQGGTVSQGSKILLGMIQKIDLLHSDEEV